MKKYYSLTLVFLMASCAVKQNNIPKARIITENKPHVEVVETQIKKVTSAAEQTVDLAKKVGEKYSSDEDVKNTIVAAKETVQKSHETEAMISSLKTRVEIADSESKQLQKQTESLFTEKQSLQATADKQKGEISTLKSDIWRQRRWMLYLSGILIGVLVLWIKPWKLFI